MSVNGRSNVELIKESRNGKKLIDDEKSRRVTFKFGLKEEKMIDEMIKALNLDEKR